MSLPAIGVVIPCYKAEHTLRQTVESVLQGAPDNLQLVLVEDGSPDGTGALCDALAAQDPRVTALHQPNGGASAARNAGLDTLCLSGESPAPGTSFSSWTSCTLWSAPAAQRGPSTRPIS